MKQPSLLKRGDRIGICAPSNSLALISCDNLEIGIKNLNAIGFDVCFSSHCFEENTSALNRAHDIMNFIVDENISAIMAGIGGFNCNEILDLLDFEQIKSANKPIIGFSDITALCIAINKLAVIITFIGPTFAVFCQKNIPDYTSQYFQKTLMLNEPIEICCSEHFAIDKWYENNNGLRHWIPNNGLKVFVKGYAKGKIIGGNMQTILALAGTKYFPNFNQKILLIEETDNKSLKEIRRAFFQLAQIGVFNEINALLIGRFYPYEKQEEIISFLLNISKELLCGFDKPFIYGYDFGHSDPMFTLPLGANLTIDNTSIVIDKGDNV